MTLSVLRLALLAAVVNGFGYFLADDCDADICWDGDDCDWDGEYRCECGMHGPYAHETEIRKYFDFDEDDSQYIKIEATVYAGGTRDSEYDVLYLCNDHEWGGHCDQIMEWEVETNSGCPPGHYESWYENSEYSVTVDFDATTADGCDYSEIMQWGGNQCVYSVYSCTRASDMGTGVQTGWEMYLKYRTGADEDLGNEYGGLGDVKITYQDHC